MMNRRQFLKSLAASGLYLAMPGISLNSATNAEIDTLWKTLEDDLVTFQVRESGIVFNPRAFVPVSRGDLFDVPALTTPDDLLNYAAMYYPIRNCLTEIYINRKTDALEEEIKHLHAQNDGTLSEDEIDSRETALEQEIDKLWKMDPEYISETEILTDWIRGADEAEFAAILEATEKWLDEPYDGWEEDYVRRKYGPDGEAFKFFEEVGFDIDEIGVEVIEGDRPGSDYCYARLRWSIEEANGAAKRLGIPIQFIQGEEY